MKKAIVIAVDDLSRSRQRIAYAQMQHPGMQGHMMQGQIGQGMMIEA